MRRKNNQIIFAPLGGAQKVGASCYYLKLGTNSILLDCGIGNNRWLKYAPDFYFLLGSGMVQSLNQISNVFISHAHLDHVGCLGEFLKENSTAGVYMTKDTRVLMRHQLKHCRLMHGNMSLTGYENLLEQRCSEVSYGQELLFKEYKVSFLPAGHIPGAMMVLIKYADKNILYTGDYSVSNTFLTEGCGFPEEKIDVLIVCGLHARCSGHVNNEQRLRKIMELATAYLMAGRSVVCKISQLSKGVELLKYINDFFKNNVPVFIDDDIMQVVRSLEHSTVPLIESNNFVLGSVEPKGPSIILSGGRSGLGLGAVQLDVDFSLHDDFAQTVDFIRKINPAQAVVVHSRPPKSQVDFSVEQVLMRDHECRTQFIFPEVGEIISL